MVHLPGCKQPIRLVVCGFLVLFTTISRGKDDCCNVRTSAYCRHVRSDTTGPSELQQCTFEDLLANFYGAQSKAKALHCDRRSYRAELSVGSERFLND